MEETKILKLKRLDPSAVLPFKERETDRGWDLTAISDPLFNDKGYVYYKTGWAIELPAGYDARLFSRSSIRNYDLVLANSVGVVDEEYRGELIVSFKGVNRFSNDNHSVLGTLMQSIPSCNSVIYKKGDRVAQLVIEKRPLFRLEVVEELSETSRGDKGFGSTGR